MRILVSHVTFPSQFRRLVPAWVEAGHDVVFITRQQEWHAFQPNGFILLASSKSRNSSGPAIHPYLRRFELAILEGQSVFRIASKLKMDGWIPDCIVSHVGFGNGLFLKDCFPSARRIGLAEWYYNATNSDVDFLPPFSVNDDHRLKLRAWNAECLLEISTLDKVVVPTFWQFNQFPPVLRSCLTVIHEGVDTKRLSSLVTADKSDFPFLPEDPNIEILTYVSRCFEEYRGFPQAMTTISRLQQLRPHLHVLIVGQDGSAYGSSRVDGLCWSDWAKRNLPLDSNRTHWLGSLQQNEYHRVLSISDVHYYLTVPFVLSWSLLESMSAGCSIVASSTPPVLEVLDENSALLVDFFDVDQHVSAVSRLLDDPSLSFSLASTARKRAEQYSFEIGLESWSRLLAD